MADWLGLARSTIALVETGKRELPGPALIRLTQFRQLLEKLPGLASDFNSITAPSISFPKRQRELKARLKKCQRQLQNLEHALTQNLERLVIWQNAIIFCSQLKLQPFILADTLLLDAVDRFQEKIWIQYLEHGDFKKEEAEFYIRQINSEIEFLESKLDQV